MDFYQELLLTGLFSVLIAFLIGKIASIPVDNDDGTDLASSAHIHMAPGSSAHAFSVHPIAEKKIERNSPPGDARDACASGVSSDDADRAEVLCFEVEPQLLDLEKEEFSKEVEVDASKVDESLTEKERDFVKKEEISVRDEKVEEKVLELGGENEDASAMDEKDGISLHGEDDWEGVECSDLEKLFGVAVEFVASEKGGDAVCKLSNEVQLQLYGLHKVATEGPCYEPKPMALMVSARSKWHAWQRLGNMNPEIAMEEYISLLTDSIPGWRVHQTTAQPKDNDCKDPVAAEISQIDQHDLTSPSYSNSGTERLVGDSYPVKDATDAVATGPKFFKDGLTKLFLVNLLSPTRVAF